MRLRVCALALLFACRPSDPKDPNTWLKRLSDSDPRTRQQAVQELRKLKAREAAPQVAQLLKDVMVREQAAAALRDIGGAGEVPALLDAVDTTVGAGSDTATRSANRTNARIAEALGEIGDPRAGPTLLRLARSKDEYVRLEAVQALGEVKFKEAVPELSLLVDDPSAPPLLVKKAVIALGQIGDPAAIPALQHALVLERQGVSLLPEASYSLFQLGPAAVPALIRVAKDEDPAYLKWARENNRAPAGTYAKAALVLGDLGDQRAVPVLLEKLKYKDPDPLAGTARLLTNLVRQFAANALGRLRDPASWHAFPGWQTVEPRVGPNGVGAKVEDNLPFVDLEATWIAEPGTSPRWTATDGVTTGARLGWEVYPLDPRANAGAPSLMALMMYPRLETTGRLARRAIASEPLLEHGLAVAVAFADLTAMKAALEKR